MIADDMPLIREGLRGMFARHPNIELVGEASDGREAVDACERLVPDVVVLEAEMPRLNGIDSIEQILSRNTLVRVIVLSARFDVDLVSRAIRSGACGYLLKDGSADELAEAIDQVAKGGVYLCPAVAKIVVEDLVRNGTGEPKKKIETLTPREREVAQLLAEGYTPPQIARQFHVSTKTVDTHRYQILKKLNLKNVAELTRLALQEGLIRLDG